MTINTCPTCGRRVPSHGPRCPECGSPWEVGDLQRVLLTSNGAELAVVRSLLDATDIPYIIQGDEAAGLFPLGPFGRSVTGRALGARVLVPRERAAEARELLGGGVSEGESDAGD